MINEAKLVERWFREGRLQKADSWSCRRVWKPAVYVVKRDGEKRPFPWRVCVATIFISPEGKEYVRSGPYDPVHRTRQFDSLPPVRLTRLAVSQIGRRLQEEQKETIRRERHQRRVVARRRRR